MPRAPYHHGDLRNALLEAAGLELAEHGPGGLSLRAVAGRAGVSHAAPAHHFGNLKGLMTALAALGFRRFGAAMAAARGAAEASPTAQLTAAGAGYVAFAIEAPQLFRLIFSGSELDWTSRELVQASEIAYRQLAEVVAGMVPGLERPEARRVELLVWSTVHGYCHLRLAGQLAIYAAENEPLPPPPDLAALLARAGD